MATQARSKSHCAQYLPLVKKAWGETALSGHFSESLGMTCRRFDGVGARLYANMVAAVESAIVPNTTRPIVLDVMDPDDGSDWYLAYYPKSRVIGMRFLQLLETLEEAERTALLLAANHPDLLAEPKPEVLQKHCGTEQIGRFERTRDINDLDPFLYHQKCRLVPGWEQL